MKIKNNNDTIISTITPSVGGSVALLRISGKNAIAISNDYFPKEDLINSSGGRFFFGQLINDNDEIIDEIILLLYRSPYSFTGEDVVEISCHANPFIVNEIINLFISKGCRLAEPGEFSKRAFLNGKMDLVQAEALADLIAAKSKAVVKNSLSQIGGKLSYIIREVQKDLITIASLLELDLDFSEEDLDIIKPDQVIKVVNQAIEKINILLKSYAYGKILIRGIEILITGKPNVGKSSLMNAFLDRDRVIVSSTPGTTRDVVHEDIIINNVLVRFIDSAGIRLTSDFIEAESVERARNVSDQANIIILVLDTSEPITQEDINIIKTTTSFYKKKMILVGNKIDKKEDRSFIAYINENNLDVFNISAKRGDHVQELKKKIIENIFNIDKNISEEVLITNERQNNSLKSTKESLQKVREGVENNVGYEFISIDIRLAIDHLSEITGEITTDDILNNIFSNFCIGK